MSTSANNFRLYAYLGAGGIFLALLAFIFFGFPDPKPMAPLVEEDKPIKKKQLQPRLQKSTLGGSKRLADGPADGEGSEENRSIIPGEVIIHGKSEAELQLIYSMALEAGGELKGGIRQLLALRMQFPSKEAADKFRESLGDGDYGDSNYIVLAPDFPTDEELAGRSPTTVSDQPNRNTNGTTGLQPFGDGALEFLGVTEDNSAWGQDLTIAILDSGVYAHESLSGINIKQYDLVETPEDPQADYTGHGTAVADIAHLVAPSADILSVRVLDSEGIGDTFTVAEGIITAADNGANVINLSLGSYGDSYVLREAVDYATDRGVAVVAASGNDGLEQVSYPAAYENVIGVTAVDAAGQFADFSNTGDGVDLGAPGVGIYTAWEEDGQVSFSGTSAAAPFVAAAIAANQTRNPGYTTAQAAARLRQSAKDTGEAGVDPQTGAGIITLE